MIATNEPSYRKIVEDYCEAVLNGEIVAGQLVRGAVRRHVEDLKHAHERGWRFDYDKAHRACLFFPTCLQHYKGEWAGEPFDLSPWQVFVTSMLFGWVDAQTGLRRFRKALVSVARKNGKTAWAAGLALKQTYWDEPDEPAGEVYCTATKEDQAKLLYSDALAMVQASIFLTGQSEIRRSPHWIKFRGNGSFLKPLGSDGDGTDGLNPHCVVMDELHAWRERHREFKKKLSTGGGARRQPLEIIITTAGDSDSLLWIEEDTYARRTIEEANSGRVYDDRYLPFVCTLDEGDDPLDETNWPKANPNLDVSVKREYLRDQARVARNAPTELNGFIRYCANTKTEANERAITAAAWALGNQPLSVEPGDKCHGGIDLGRTKDFTAIALCFPRYTTNHEGQIVATHHELLTRTWVAQNGNIDLRHEPFASWIRDGHLRVCSGDSIDFAEVEAECVKLAEMYTVLTWAYDDRFAKELAQRLQDMHGLTIFNFNQSHRFYNEPTRKFVDVECPGGRIIHGGDPCLAWQAANMQINRNSKDEWMPDKSNPKRKIDAMVASLMAFSECLFAAKEGGWYNATNPVEIG